MLQRLERNIHAQTDLTVARAPARRGHARLPRGQEAAYRTLGYFSVPFRVKHLPGFHIHNLHITRKEGLVLAEHLGGVRFP